MANKATKIKGRKLHEYTFEHESKKYKYVIQDPQFEQLVAAQGELYNSKGDLSLMTAGKVIWELCCVEFDQEIEENSKMLMTVCIRLSEFVLPLDIEIKKK